MLNEWYFRYMWLGENTLIGNSNGEVILGGKFSIHIARIIFGENDGQNDRNH